MYTHIPTEHALGELCKYFTENQPNFGHYYALTLMSSLETVNNILNFGDYFRKQTVEGEHQCESHLH